MHDLHVHSNYSDGAFLESMIEAAEDAGLNGIGIADHCYVSARQSFQDVRARVGMNLDRTYERRRRAIDQLRAEASIGVYDAAEVDYDPRDEAEIRAFLDEADFEYVVGSVHRVDDVNVQVESAVVDRTDAALNTLVDRYYEQLVSLIESGLFDVVAHVDLPERTPALRDRATEQHYRRVATVLADAEIVAEINAGRSLTEDGIVHPSPRFLEVLSEHDVSVSAGSDAHGPTELVERAAFLTEFFESRDLIAVGPPHRTP